MSTEIPVANPSRVSGKPKAVPELLSFDGGHINPPDGMKTDPEKLQAIYDSPVNAGHGWNQRDRRPERRLTLAVASTSWREAARA